MLVKNSLKKIGKSFGRFASLIAIILIGTGFYAGIRQSTPAIRDAQTEFVTSSNMMDFHIVSTLGITEDDVEALSKLGGVDTVSPGYSEYVFFGDDVIRVMSLDEKINIPEIYEGEMPNRPDECLADKNYFAVGDIVTVKEPGEKDSDGSDVIYQDATDTSDDDEDDDDEYLVEKKFTVVGTIISPLYMGEDTGSVPIGNGELASYILVEPEAFEMETYSDVYITMKKDEADVPYSDSYQDKFDDLNTKINRLKPGREQAREDELLEEAKQTAYYEVEGRRGEIEEEVREELEASIREELEAQQDEKNQELAEQAAMFGMTFSELVSTLSEEVQSFLEPLTDEQVSNLADDQIDEAMETAMEEAHEKAEEEIEIPEAKWFIQTRNDVVAGYKSLIDQYTIVESIADIIPLFFVVVVFLMTMNTMSRMIAEERGEMGSLLSLGFSNVQIIGSYMLYVMTATIVGVVGGYFLGIDTLPRFVFNCFPVYFKEIAVNINWKMLIGEFVIAFAVITIVTIISCMKELVHKPAYLLRPVPPNKGKAILLEKIGFIWNHLSFSWKTTIRNLMRQKRRVLMTVIGVGGCTFLMLIGFSLRDCISTIGDAQFTDIHHYDVMTVFDDEYGSLASIDTDGVDLEKYLVDPLMLHFESMEVKNDSDYSVDVYMIVPRQGSGFEDYFTLREADPRDIKTKSGDRDSIEMGTPLTIPTEENGVIVTPRICEVLDVGIGDEFELINEDGEKYTLKIEGVAENHVSNYVYMSTPVYVNMFGKALRYNAVVAGNKYRETASSGETASIGSADEATISMWEEQDEKLSEKLYDIDAVVSVSTSTNLLKTANEAVHGLDTVVIMLTVIAGLLSFTVLYNLTSISISERVREIATLKVLGFTPYETNDYIYRETLIGSILGIAAGLAVNPYLHGIIMDILSMDNILFLRTVNPRSYIISAALALSFTLVMMVVTAIKLARVNMIESLKSVD